MSVFNWKYKNDTFILSEAQSREVEDYSSSQPDDGLFNEWFEDYLESNKVPKKHYGRAQYWSRVPDSKDDISRLVTVKQSAAALMKVVDPTIAIREIEFDGKGTGATIPSEPAVKAASLHEAMDNTAGFAIHSAFRETFSGLPGASRARLTQDSVSDIKKDIYGVLEAMRANSRGLIENPGFADYIENATDYVYNGYQIPEEWPSTDPNAQLAALLAPLVYGSRVGDIGATPYSDKAAEAHRIAAQYVDCDKVTIHSAQEAVSSIENLLEISEESEKNPSPCPLSLLPSSGEGLTTNVKDEISNRIDMEQEVIEGFASDAMNDGVFAETLIKVRPYRKPISKIEAIPGGVLKADAHLRLRKTLDKRTEHFQKSGDLDEDELYRLMLRDDRVFMNVEEEQEESASIHFLIDASGSMSADVGYDRVRPYESPTRIDIAAQLAWLFAHSMNKRQHVTSRVWAHTGDGYIMDSTMHTGPIIYDIWKSNEPLDRINLIKDIAMSQNYDGFAIDYVGRVLRDEEAEKKYLIVLSDGIPSAGNYGGLPALKHVRQVTDALLKKGIHVVQIAVGNGLNKGQQAQQFKHFVMYTTLDQTIREFARILEKAR